MFAVNSLLNVRLQPHRCTTQSRVSKEAQGFARFHSSGSHGSGQRYALPRLFLNRCFLDFTFSVICNFRSPICQALVLEIGETVQILEKSEGEMSVCDVIIQAVFYKTMFQVSVVVGIFSSQR